MRVRLSKVAAIAAAAVALPSAAWAHTGVGDAAGFLHGVAHPLSGLDHVLAMAMVGVLAAQLGGRALWLVPLGFVLVMTAGGALGAAGIGVPFVEFAIALSVVVLGGAVALGLRLPVAAAAAVAGFFALFHGYAHGTEMPADATGLAYGLGFVAATTVLHLAGLGLGAGLARRIGDAAVRALGGLAALAGLGLLAGAV
jgi:urease accessory protein